MVSKYSIFASIFLAIGFVILLVSLYSAIPKYSPSKPFTKNLYSCSIDQDCGLNICDCVAQRDDTIENSKRLCTRVCESVSKCINQKCQLVKLTPSPKPPALDLSTFQTPSTWPIYKNSTYNFQLNYPLNSTIYSKENNRIEIVSNDFKEKYTNEFLANDILNGIKLLIDINYHGCNEPLPGEGFLYENTIINDLSARLIRFTNEPIEQIRSVDFLTDENCVSLQVIYGRNHDSDWYQIFNQIIQSFKSISQETITKYTCPATEWVDCMPIIDGPKKEFCSQEYLTWAKLNCPNFQGAAL